MPPTRRRVVDPHIHLWDLRTGIYPHFERPSKGRHGSNAAIARSYLLDEFLDEGDGAVEIAGAVHVEAFPTEPVKETETLQRVADSSPIPLAVVGHADLTSPGFAELLDRHAAFPSFRGIRQVVNRHPRPEYTYVDRDLMAEPLFLQGLKRLGQRGFSFDLQLYPHQMAQATTLAAQASDTLLILNHDGMWADRDRAGWAEWKAGLRALAAEPNVAVKISGFGMMDPDWTAESVRPLVYETLDAFGTERAMFASNFPVDKLTSTYPVLWSRFARVVTDLSDDEQQAMFHDNAVRFYRLEMPAKGLSGSP